MAGAGQARSTYSGKQLALHLEGRLRNFRLAPSRGLVPLFEAVINSIQAIDSAVCTRGEIVVDLLRAAQQEMTLPPDAEAPLGPITGFSIRDNGIGLPMRTTFLSRLPILLTSFGSAGEA